MDILARPDMVELGRYKTDYICQNVQGYMGKNTAYPQRVGAQEQSWTECTDDVGFPTVC